MKGCAMAAYIITGALDSESGERITISQRYRFNLHKRTLARQRSSHHPNLLWSDWKMPVPSVDEFKHFMAESNVTPMARVYVNRLLHAINRYVRDTQREILIEHRHTNYFINVRPVYQDRSL